MLGGEVRKRRIGESWACLWCLQQWLGEKERVSRLRRGGRGGRIYYLCLCVTGRVREDGSAKADWALV